MRPSLDTSVEIMKILFHFISFHFILIYFISFHFILIYFISFHFILFYFVLFYFQKKHGKAECSDGHSQSHFQLHFN